MIITDRTITVKKGVSTIDEPVILYRGDYDVEVRFVIKNSRFLFLFETTQLETNNASYAQLAIIKPDGDNVFSDISTCTEGAVSFTLTSDMIDELHDVGLYSFQIRLYDEDQQSRASIPPVEYGIEIREPIASEDHTNAVDEALVGYSIAKTTSIDNEPVGPTFDDAGEYNVTQWETGDRITEGKLNKIEDALDTLNQNDKSLDRRIVNNYNALTNSFQELSDGVTVDIQEMNDTIDTNFQEMNNTIDTNFQEMNDTIDTNFQEMNSTLNGTIDANIQEMNANIQEIRNEIPTSVSQLEYDINDNLICNGRFKGVEPNMTTGIDKWTMWGGIRIYRDEAYNTINKNLALSMTEEEVPGGIAQDIKGKIPTEGEKITLSFFCDWQENVKNPSIYVEFRQNDDTLLDSIRAGLNTNGEQVYTFTMIECEILRIGFMSDGAKVDAGGRYINWYINNVKLELGDKATPWVENFHYTHIYKPGPGNWFNDGTPVIDLVGCMEIGRNIDFHFSSDTTSDYSARIASESDGHINMYAWFHPGEDNKYDIGGTSKRWRYINLVNNPTVSSDRTLKENISYIKNEKAKSVPTDEIVTYEDMYDFVKNDLELATYNFIGQEEQNMNFIAQDLLYNLDGTDNKIGQMIINPVAPPTEEEIEEAKSKIGEDQEYTYPTLSYDMGMYISVLAGALKTALNKIDALEEQIASIQNGEE